MFGRLEEIRGSGVLRDSFGLDRAETTASGRVRKAALVVLAAGGIFTASAGQAASLGRLTVLSGSGEPLRAQIEVTAIQPGEAESLRAALAPAEIYRQTQLDHPDFLSSVRVAVADLPDGRKVVRVSSDAPIEARVVDLLVDLNWASGRFIRQYSFFVDPPAPLRAAATASEIRVARGDTLSGVAQRIGYTGASLEQVLVALQQANPSAFDSGNVNRLRAGSTLRVPDADTVRSIDQAAARRNLATQQAEFERLRAGRGSAAVRRTGAATPQQASGTISATSTDKPAPAPDERDRLRLSAAGPAAAGTGGSGSGTGNVRATQEAADRSAEEIAAKDKALQEAQSRVSELERNVADMQRLLTVQSAALAEAEARANAASAAALAAPTGSASPTVMPPVAATPPAAQTVAPVAPGETPVGDGTARLEPTTPAADAAATGLQAYATPQRIGIALVVILFLLLLALLIARRRREKRLSALAAGAALATAAAPAWAEPAQPVRAAEIDEEELAAHADDVAPPVRPVDFGFNLDLDKPVPAESVARNAALDPDLDDEPPPRLLKSSADVPEIVVPEPVPVAPVVAPVVAPIVATRDEPKIDWPDPEPEPARPATAAFAPLVTPDPAAGVDLTEDNASKLELADAYLEIGDKEGARELLEDVIKGGTAAQQERARETLASLR
jgi:pilus assembly protein FimV